MKNLVKCLILIIFILNLLSSSAVSYTDPDNNIWNVVEKGDIKTLQVLLANGADVNAKDKYGRTALIFAVVHEQTEIVKVLLAQKGIDVNLKTKEGGETALMIAAFDQDRIEIVKALLAKKEIDVNAKNVVGETALMTASLKGNTDIVKALLAIKNIDVNAKSMLGGTALIAASLKGNTEIVRALLSIKNIDVNIKGENGKTALYCASQMGHIEILRLLVKAGAVIDNIPWSSDFPIDILRQTPSSNTPKKYGLESTKDGKHIVQFSAGDFVREESKNVMENIAFNNLVTNNGGNNDRLPQKLTYRFQAIKGNYELEISYAAGTESRPVEVYINGKMITDNALTELTGSWTTVKIEVIGHVTLKNGENTLVIMRNTAIPHLQSITFRPL